MSSSETSFEDVSDIWREHEDTVRGALRYNLSGENIELFLGDPTLRVLDLGAGTCPVSAWLAKKGHNVIAVEPSARNLEHARERFANELSDEERGQVRLIHGDISELGDDRYKESFDFILSHCVAMYLAEPEEYWQSAWSLLKPGGHMSVLESGYVATMKDLRRGGAGSMEALAQFRVTRRYTNNMGHDARAFKFSEIENVFKALGARIILKAGVRFEKGDSMYTRLEDFDPDEYQRILSEERMFGRDPKAMEHAQMLQLIFRKPNRGSLRLVL